MLQLYVPSYSMLAQIVLSWETFIEVAGIDCWVEDLSDMAVAEKIRRPAFQITLKKNRFLGLEAAEGEYRGQKFQLAPKFEEVYASLEFSAYEFQSNNVRDLAERQVRALMLDFWRSYNNAKRCYKTLLAARRLKATLMYNPAMLGVWDARGAFNLGAWGLGWPINEKLREAEYCPTENAWRFAPSDIFPYNLRRTRHDSVRHAD